MPFLYISPSALLWAGVTGGVMGIGLKMTRTDAEEAEEGKEVMRGFLGGALAAAGVYLAAPGALRAFMVYR